MCVFHPARCGIARKHLTPNIVQSNARTEPEHHYFCWHFSFHNLCSKDRRDTFFDFTIDLQEISCNAGIFSTLQYGISCVSYNPCAMQSSSGQQIGGALLLDRLTGTTHTTSGMGNASSLLVESPGPDCDFL